MLLAAVLVLGDRQRRRIHAAAQAMSTEQIAPVIALQPRAAGPARRRRGRRPNLIVLVVAGALACSPLAFGYYDFTSWAPLGVGAVVLLVMLAFGPAPALGRYGSRRRARPRVAAAAELRVDPVGRVARLGLDQRQPDRRLRGRVRDRAAGDPRAHHGSRHDARARASGAAERGRARGAVHRGQRWQRLPAGPAEQPDGLHQRHRRPVRDGHLAVVRACRDVELALAARGIDRRRIADRRAPPC